MTDRDELRRLITSWRAYRQMLTIDPRIVPLDRAYYQQLIGFFALIIRRRIGR